MHLLVFVKIYTERFHKTLPKIKTHLCYNWQHSTEFHGSHSLQATKMFRKVKLVEHAGHKFRSLKRYENKQQFAYAPRPPRKNKK
jgi:hypothetical protein